MRVPLQIGLIVLVAACGSRVESGALAPAAGPVSASPVFLKACASGARPQTELDFAGLPPLVPTSSSMSCLLNAVSGSTSYDGGHDFVIQLTDRRVLHIYERRGSRPVKDGASPSLRRGERDVNGAKWEWATLANGATILDVTSGGVYAELLLAGDESQVDTLVEVARSLRPVEALPRPSARDICAALPISPNSYVLAAAFASSAGSVVKWQETLLSPDGPRPVSQWRDHPAAEPVAVCYLDGDFGSAKGAPGPPGYGATSMPLANWDRVIYLVGADRRPIGVTFGRQGSIAIRDPGP
ncbi:MAG: hypothetical protein M3T56_19200 [Chloroflexota bacterium]|nr:hypothetical protein [Chloroflexota bacterium]